VVSVDEHRMLGAVLVALFGFYEENLQQGQGEAQLASTTMSASRMKRWESSCPIATPSLLLIVACAPQRAERGNIARSCLHLVGYVTVKGQGI
jgi:hypothetical protein